MSHHPPREDTRVKNDRYSDLNIEELSPSILQSFNYNVPDVLLALAQSRTFPTIPNKQDIGKVNRVVRHKFIERNVKITRV